MALPSCNHEPMELDRLLFQILRKSLGQGCLGAKFWYQPREALNSGSLHNSFAFNQRINPLTAIPVKDKTSSDIFKSLFWLVLTTSETDQSQAVVLTALVNMATRSIWQESAGFGLKRRTYPDFFALKTTPEVFDPIQDTSAHNSPSSFVLLTFSARHWRGSLDLFASDEPWIHWCPILWQSWSCSQRPLPQPQFLIWRPSCTMNDELLEWWSITDNFERACDCLRQDSELRWWFVMHAVLFIHFWNVNSDHIKFILPVICSYFQLSDQ